MSSKYNNDLESSSFLGMDSFEPEESSDYWQTKDTTDAVPQWTKGLTQDDMNAIYQMGALSTNGLLAEVKKIFDQSYQLGLQEAKEVTKGKNLNILSSTKRK
ncbi:protein lin-52 homolog isoform X2 [Anopheles cruzii]|uniref:protein lin-52 homolog isoform X2 n=1 Tax=Anopheles cruzii TaxID=68878 RepID=UPI0022EC464A|nr:protein lin-52 homolog isoform X2 [Anopheles cruzii]